MPVLPKTLKEFIAWLVAAGLSVALIVFLLFFALCDDDGGGDDDAGGATPTPASMATPTPAPTAAVTPSPTAEPTATLDVSGDWRLRKVETSATCADDAEQVGTESTSDIVIKQNGEGLTVSGLGGDDGTGTITGDKLTFTATFPEDKGETTGVFTLTVNLADRTLSGTEAWTWEGQGGPCLGTADVKPVSP
jgi:hypothetical protein